MIKNIYASWTMSTYVVDHQAQVLLNTTGKARIPHCPFGVIGTDHPNLYIADTSKITTLPVVDPSEVDVTLQASVHMNYLAYSMRNTLTRLDSNLATTMCKDKYQGKEDRPVRIEGNTHGLIRGDLLLQFDCQEKMGYIQEADRCYTDIPLIGGGFVSPFNKQWQNHSTHVPCSSTFPLTVRTHEAWIQITPILKVRPQPLQLDSHVLNLTYRDYSHGGLYTEQELADWMHTLSFPKYEAATLRELIY
ncbi:MAG: hypothetical protein GY696_40730, partial [Gammaproteobacteria bacterium]|nr:hypothetical protein [Gammaproteobacteria bacterium]